MGFFDFLFGKKKAKETAVPVVAESVKESVPEVSIPPGTDAVKEGGISSEIVAVIAGAVSAVMGEEASFRITRTWAQEPPSPEVVAAIAAAVSAASDEDVTFRITPTWGQEAPSPEIVAAITAAVYEMMGTSDLAIRITRTSKTWAAVGRQKLMDGRSFA